MANIRTQSMEDPLMMKKEEKSGVILRIWG